MTTNRRLKLGRSAVEDGHERGDTVNHQWGVKLTRIHLDSTCEIRTMSMYRANTNDRLTYGVGRRRGYSFRRSGWTSH